MGETLILLSEYGGRLFDQRLGASVESHVSDLVRKLLSPLDMQRLLSFEDDLAALAEAAPQVFLEAIEDDLRGDEPAALQLMKPVDSGIFGSGCSRTGILWALECVAWSPEYLSRVVDILARLSRRTIDDNWTTTPRNTLLSIFRYWMPETAAGVEQRMKALEGLVDRHPEIGWSVSLALARVPRTSIVALPNYRPQWRGNPSSPRRPITRDEGRRFVRTARDICLNWPMHDERTLGDLVDSLEELDDPTRNKVCDLLDRWTAEPQSDQAKESLRERIRRCALSDALRSNNIVERIRRTMGKLEPSDLVVRYRWLFASVWPRCDLYDADSTFDQITQRIHVQRLDALRTIWHERGFGGLNGLCTYGAAPHVVGSLMPEILSHTQETVSFVRWCLDKMSENGTQRYEPSLNSFLSWNDVDSLPALMKDIGISHGDSGRLRLYTSMPYTTAWKLLNTEPDPIRRAYWEKVDFEPGRYSAEEINLLVDRLLEADRPLAVLKPVSDRWDTMETSRLTKLLHALADQKKRFDSSSIPGAFQSLNRRSDVTDEEKARLEFAFFRTLNRSRYQMPNLSRLVVASPGLYAEVVIRTFSRRDGCKDPSELCIGDNEQRKELAYVAKEVLQWINHIPGSGAGGAIDTEHLIAWLAEVRALCARYGRAAVGDRCIGELLSRARPDEEGRWPCRAVCEALERMSCGDVDRGFMIGRSRARGIVTRQAGERGDQERELAAKYRDQAQRIAYEYPHVSSILARIANGYEHDAGRQDTNANLQRRFPKW